MEDWPWIGRALATLGLIAATLVFIAIFIAGLIAWGEKFEEWNNERKFQEFRRDFKETQTHDSYDML